MANRTHSLSETAAILGKHRNTLSKWLEQGCPAVQRADRARGVEWALSIPDIVDWLVDRAVSNAVQTAGGEVGLISKDEADRRKAVAQAVAEEVTTAELLDDVVNAREAAADVAAFVVALRTALANVAGKVAGRAASMTSAAEIREFAEAEMNRALAAAEQDLSDRWKIDADEREAGGGAGPDSRP